MSFLDHIRRCNNFDPRGFRPLRIGAVRVGWVRHTFAERLAAFPEGFAVGPDSVELAPGQDSFAARTKVVERVLRTLAETGEITGWRDEPYPVVPARGKAPLLQVERAACPYLGIRAWGVHMNGFVRRADGLHLWVARRARGKATYPGKLDNMVAGGQPIGLGLMENLIKECAEEAGIPAALARRAVPVGVISYRHETPEGVKPDQQYCFDLELPETFEPRNVDGEVEAFMLWPVERVAETVRETTEFKFNCNLVIIDFLIRHGVIRPDDEPDYAELCLGLRRDETEPENISR